MGKLAAALAQLHHIHRRLAELCGRLERGPKQVRAAEANVKQCEAEQAKAKDVYKAAKLASDEKQLQLRTREAKLLDWQAKLMQAQNNREYQALKEQIAADKQANSVLSDEILESLEKLDELTAAVKLAGENLTKTQDELAKVRARVNEQQQKLETELAGVQVELTAAEEVLPDDMRADFIRVSKVRGEEAMAPVEGEVCGGCNQTLTAQMLDMLRLDRIIHCKACGRLLYQPE